MSKIIKTTIVDMKNHLYSLGIAKGDSILLHSSFFAFGQLTFKLDELYSLILSLIGRDGTLILPSYTLQLTEHDIYDKHSTKAHNIGIFSEWIIENIKHTRSNTPFHNHIAIGKHAESFNQSSEFHSFGPNSDFKKIEDMNCKIILLGTDFTNGCTYMHHLEAENNVPYRKWIKLNRKIKKNGVVDVISCHYFARNESFEKTHFNRIINYLDNLITASAPYGKSYAINVRALKQAVNLILCQSAYFFVKDNCDVDITNREVPQTS